MPSYIKPEQALQINVINWLAYQYPNITDDVYHFANERKCTIQQGRLLKRMGVKRGVADLFLGIPRHGKSGLWVEAKTVGHYPSPDQKEFLQRQVNNNFAAACCWEFENITTIFKKYLSADDLSEYFNNVIYLKGE